MFDLSQKFIFRVEKSILNLAQNLNPQLTYKEIGDLFEIEISLDYLFRIFNVYDFEYGKKIQVDKIVQVQNISLTWSKISSLQQKKSTKYKISFNCGKSFICDKEHPVVSDVQAPAVKISQASNVFNINSKSYEEILNVTKLPDGSAVGDFKIDSLGYYLTPDGFVHYSY